MKEVSDGGTEEYKRIKDMWRVNSKMAGINPIISVILLHINDLNTPIKRKKLEDWIKKW